MFYRLTSNSKIKKNLEGKAFVIRDDNTRTPEQEVVRAELLEDLAENIQRLNEKEQLVLSLFYTEEMTLTEIGEMLELIDITYFTNSFESTF